MQTARKPKPLTSAERQRALRGRAAEKLVVLLDAAHSAALDTLQVATGLPRTQIVRDLIHAAAAPRAKKR